MWSRVLGAGSEAGQGTVVFPLRPTKIRIQTFAMKVEPRMKNKEEEILKVSVREIEDQSPFQMEIYVLKKLQLSKHVCRFVASGFYSNFR